MKQHGVNYVARKDPNKVYVIRGKLKVFYDSITDDEHDYDYLDTLRESIGDIVEDADKYGISIDEAMFAIEKAMKKIK
jgi:hypothetical protein